MINGKHEQETHSAKIGAYKSAENTPNVQKFIGPNCLPKPKSLEFWWEKASLGVRSPWSWWWMSKKKSLELKRFWISALHMYVCILIVQCTHCSFSTCGWIVPLLANLALNLPHKVTVKLSKNTFGISYFPISNRKCTYRLRGPNFKYKMNFDMSLDCLLKRIWHPWFTNL